MKIRDLKKTGVFFAVMAMLFTTIVSTGISYAASGSSPEPKSGILYGDINNDGGINAIDFALYKQYIMNTSNKYVEYLDLNMDNSVDAVDFSILKRFLLGTIETLPYGSIPAAPGVQYIGRFDNSDSAGPKFAWSNTTIKANFKGTGISANLKSTGDNWFNIVIDGTFKAPLNTPAGSSASYTLASGLTNGNHTVELIKRTEASIGEVQFLGFTVKDGALLAPSSPANRRIEFIGDSITCGYGNEGTTQYQSFTAKNENASLAYGALTAKQLAADTMTICWSGKGAYRNYGGAAGELLPDLYSRILPYNTNLKWDSSKWIPQVVVINLGTNDFSTGTPDKSAFTAAYLSFVDRIRAQYPNADIYCAIGPMLSGDQLASCKGCVTSVVNKKNTSGDTKIHFIEFPVQDAVNGYGEDWHPSIKTHQLMADQLTSQLKKDLGW